MRFPPIFEWCEINLESGVNLKCKILHLEDSDDDSFFFRRALRFVGYSGAYSRVCGVFDARRFLAGEGEFCDRVQFPWPDILVVDSTLPGVESTQHFLA
jgi:hypothetical protein